jgi:plastocyanin
MTESSRRVIAATLLIVAFAACKSDKEIGDESLLDFREKEQQRLGQTSPTPSPPPQQAAPPSQGKQGVGQAAPQPRPEQPVIKVAINSDSAGSQFDPSVVRVSRGAKVSWTNQDQTAGARSVEFDDGSVKSGQIAQGATWTWTADRVGKFGYHDGTRPYAVASVEVVG